MRIFVNLKFPHPRFTPKFLNPWPPFSENTLCWKEIIGKTRDYISLVSFPICLTIWNIIVFAMNKNSLTKFWLRFSLDNSPFYWYIYQYAVHWKSNQGDHKSQGNLLESNGKRPGDCPWKSFPISARGRQSRMEENQANSWLSELRYFAEAKKKKNKFGKAKPVQFKTARGRAKWR